jgi:anti-sigma factor RsiW
MVEINDALLWRFLDGELPEAEAARIEDAVAAEPALAARLDGLRAIGEGVLVGAPRPPSGFAAKVAASAQLRGARPPAELIEMRRFARRVLVAAAILAAVGLAYLALDFVPDVFDRLVAGTDPLLDQR